MVYAVEDINVYQVIHLDFTWSFEIHDTCSTANTALMNASPQFRIRSNHTRLYAQSFAAM